MTITFGTLSDGAARISPVQQWAALSGRILREMTRNGEHFVAMLSPIIFTLGYYIPLRKIMELPELVGGGGLGNYGQFLMPVIALQAVSFTAMSAAFRAARETESGMSSRLYTMPIPVIVPLAARMSASAVRAFLSLGSALICGYVIGFRFEGGFVNSVAFCALGLSVGFAFTLGADAVGTISANPRATSQALVLPQLILGMLSTGFVPEQGFPEWIRPFVRNQPISQFAEAMRQFNDGTATLQSTFPALMWAAGMLAAFGGLALWASLRRK